MNPIKTLAIVLLAGLLASAQQAAPPTPATPASQAATAGGPPRTGPNRVRPLPIDPSDHDGFTQLFDGVTLSNWDGNPDVWSVENGVIAGQYKSPEGTRNPQTFLIYKGSQPADFELRLEIKLEGVTADSGIQYRSFMAPPPAPRPGMSGAMADPRWNVDGYQFDFNFINTYPGQVVDGGGRGIIASRGEVVQTQAGKPPRLLASLGTTEELGGYFKINDWNQVDLIARGHVLTQILNGHVMAILDDEDDSKFKSSGLIALQCAGSGTVKISFRNIWLKEIK